MNVRLVRKSIWILAAIFFFFVGGGVSRAQQSGAMGSIQGQVVDPSGSTVTGAAILVSGKDGQSHDFVSGKDGNYTAIGLAPGRYTVKVVAEGFGAFTANNVTVTAGKVQNLKISLTLEEQKIEIHVEDSPTQLSVDPSQNAGAIILKGADLDALSDDPDELMRVAGPSGAVGGTERRTDLYRWIYGGQLPPKASIREIRINQNPFSAEYDKLGYGRIEIFTKPGTDRFHGQLFLTGNTAGFNSRNPFEVIPAGTTPPGYDSTQFSASIGGPLTKKASFFLISSGGISMIWGL